MKILASFLTKTCKSIARSKQNIMGSSIFKFSKSAKPKVGELKTLKEMQKYNKKVHGVKCFDVQDEEFASFLTKGFDDFVYKTSGQYKIPKNIIVCDLPNPNGYMFYEKSKDVLAISKKHIENFREIAKSNGETLEQTLNRWGRNKFDGAYTSGYVKGSYQELFHELGHKAHAASYKNFGKIDSNWNLKATQETAAKVSKYATKSPEEFVAETFSFLTKGEKLPSDVMALYKKYGGPSVKNPDAVMKEIAMAFLKGDCAEMSFKELVQMGKLKA